MKRIWIVIPVLVWILWMIALLFAGTHPVSAMGLYQAPPPPADPIGAVTQAFLALFGWPALLAAVINVAKMLGLPDGTSSTISYWANILVWIGVAYFVFTGQTSILSTIDGALAGLAKIVVDIGILIAGTIAHMGLTRFMNTNIKGLPLIGYAHPSKFKSV